MIGIRPSFFVSCPHKKMAHTGDRSSRINGQDSPKHVQIGFGVIMASNKGSYYPRTTAQQRILLFRTWEETDNIDEACRVASVSRRTFYIWRPRFEASGYEGLVAYESRAPKEPFRTPADVEQQVIKLRRENPDWGKERIAKALAEANNAESSASPNTIRRILQDAGLWKNRSFE